MFKSCDRDIAEIRESLRHIGAPPRDPRTTLMWPTDSIYMQKRMYPNLGELFDRIESLEKKLGLKYNFGGIEKIPPQHVDIKSDQKGKAEWPQ